MNNTHKVNLYYSVFLIIIGLVGFFLRYADQGDFQFTSLIPSIFGLVLLPMTGPIKRDSAIIGHIAVGITIILAIMVTVMFFKNNMGGFHFDRKTIIFLLTGIVSWVVVGIYVKGFLTRRKSNQ